MRRCTRPTNLAARPTNRTTPVRVSASVVPRAQRSASHLCRRYSTTTSAGATPIGGMPHPDFIDVQQWIDKYLKEIKLDYNEKHCKHHRDIPFSKEHFPKIAVSAVVSPSATLSGGVELWEHSTVWNNAVLRGDINLVRVGAYTSVQDGAVIHEAFEPINAEHDGSTIIGHYCHIGSNVSMRAVTLEDEVIGDGAYIESGVVIGQGSYVPPKTRIPSGQFWSGRPVKYIRTLTDRERQWIIRSAVSHSEGAAAEYQEMFFLDPQAYQEKFEIGIDEPHLYLRQKKTAAPKPKT